MMLHWTARRVLASTTAESAAPGPQACATSRIVCTSRASLVDGALGCSRPEIGPAGYSFGAAVARKKAAGAKACAVRRREVGIAAEKP